MCALKYFILLYQFENMSKRFWTLSRQLKAKNSNLKLKKARDHEGSLSDNKVFGKCLKKGHFI